MNIYVYQICDKFFEYVFRLFIAYRKRNHAIYARMNTRPQDRRI